MRQRGYLGETTSQIEALVKEDVFVKFLSNWILEKLDMTRLMLSFSFLEFEALLIVCFGAIELNDMKCSFTRQ
jgi:hypothetical protein